MSNFIFSEQAQVALKAAGWTPNRAFDITNIELAYEKDELILHDTAKEFLREFGNLIIEYITETKQRDILAFHVANAIRGLNSDGLKIVESIFGVDALCPIGQFACGMCMLLQGLDGKVFALSDISTLLVGESGHQAIENIISNKSIKILSIEDQ